LVTNRNKIGFSCSDICKFANVKPHQLRYWTEKGIVKASASVGRRKHNERRYNVRDVLTVLVIKELREKGLSLQRIRESVKKVQIAGINHPLSKLRVACLAHAVLFKQEDKYVEPISGQMVIEQALDTIRPHLNRRQIAPTERAVEKSNYQYTKKIAAL